MKKLKMFFDFDKEEAWLNRMAAEGNLLVKANGIYTFAPIPPGTAVVRVDYRDTMKPADFDDYRNLFWDAGWQHVAGTRGSGAQYFASFSGDTNAQIFSDASSRAQRYRKAIGMSAITLLPLAIIIMSLWSSGSSVLWTLFTPSEWYLTPDIWDLQGWDFVRAFLFETPFVVMRLGLPLLLAGATVAVAATMAYQYVLYRRSRVSVAT